MATLYEIFRDSFINTRHCEQDYFENLMLMWYFEFGLHFFDD